MSKINFDTLDATSEWILVESAVRQKAARQLLRRVARHQVAQIADLYVAFGLSRSKTIMVNAAMRQFDPILNEYGNRMLGVSAPSIRFSLYLTWWSTRRIEQFVRQKAVK